MLRPISEIQADHQERVLERQNWYAFPLAEDAAREIPVCFVDFRRLTTVRPGVLLPGNRVASLREDTRKALARYFWGYLMRPPLTSL